MIEVIERPDHTDAWYRMSQSGEIEWSVFDDFRSSVDWPTVRYWREMATHYPAAKIVLSTRDPESWYKSVSERSTVA